jgi:ABC-type uncharacterized transport system auxiliary subunit
MNMKNIGRKALAPMLACAFLLAGCATPASQEAMVPAMLSTLNKHPQTVSVSVSGGKETNALGKAQIDNDAFAKALTQAIENSKTFSKVIEGNKGNYLLAVNIFSLDQPSFGGNFTVHLEAGWTLKRADNGSVVWQEAIRSEHTATMSDALVAVTRLRMATEGAAKNNVAQGLEKISKLSL